MAGLSVVRVNTQKGVAPERRSHLVRAASPDVRATGLSLCRDADEKPRHCRRVGTGSLRASLVLATYAPGRAGLPALALSGNYEPGPRLPSTPPARSHHPFLGSAGGRSGR